LQYSQAWGKKCAASKKFQLTGKDGKTFNFLDYVGTELLAQDIDRLRQAMGAEKMSIYGYSYGTYVAGVYATAFSHVTGRVVLNGNMAPMPRKQLQAAGDAGANDKFVAELFANCHSFPANCSLKEPEKELEEILAAARSGELTAKTKSGEAFPLTVGMLLAYLQYESTSSSGIGYPAATKTLAKLSPSSKNASSREEAVAYILDGFCMVKWNATWYNFDVCIGPGQTAEDEGTSMGDPYLNQVAVWGIDQAGFFNVADLMRQWHRASEDHGEAGLAAYVGDMAGFFLWPQKATPNAPIGKPDLQVLIVGNLFDTSTSYYWSQEMRRAFPSGALITWQGVGHTLPAGGTIYDADAISACTAHVTEYLKFGTLPLDGFVCREHQPVPVGLL